MMAATYVQLMDGHHGTKIRGWEDARGRFALIRKAGGGCESGPVSRTWANEAAAMRDMYPPARRRAGR